MEKYTITFLPAGQRMEVYGGTTLMKAMREGEVDYDFPCGGTRRCGKCRIRIINGITECDDIEREFLAEQEINEGVHLACFTEIHSDCTIELIQVKGAQHQILWASQERTIKLNPHISKKYIEVKKPSLRDHQSDWKRFKKSLFEGKEETGTALDMQIHILRQLPEVLRSAEYRLTAITYGREIIGIEHQDTTETLLGMAFDIGTTTIVGYLIDLHSGKELSIASMLNPQTKFGADVISRCDYVNQEEKGLENLHLEVIRAINSLVVEVSEKAGVDREGIYLITIAGNTCMHHLFLGLSPRYIAISPYIPTISEPVVLNSQNLPIKINKAGKILVLPNISGFVGADTVAVLLATELDKSDEVKLMIDIGTNGEIVLGSKDKLFACSTAAGPAFEGAQISSGMRGASGAIDHVRFGEKLEYSVIGGGKPLGICGSGLLDVVAGLLDLGIIDEKGRFSSSEKISNPAAESYKENIVQHEGIEAFLLVDESDAAHGNAIMVTQKDIRELQLAKGAMRAGIKILMEKCGVALEDVQEVLLAGAFGNYLNPKSACAVGLIPKELEGRIKMVGNAAGTGAKLALLSQSEYRRAGEIADNVKFVELASHPEFSSIFARAMYFR